MEVTKGMKKLVFAEGICFYKLFCVCIVGSVLGDILETIYCYFKYKKWKSRSSFVYGHMSIVWGFAFVVATVMYYTMGNASSLCIFIVGTILGGAYEYLCSVLAERHLGVKFWDYSTFSHNLSGRINLTYCLFWGMAALLWIRWLFPFLEILIESIPVTIGPIICNVLAIAVFIDGLLSLVALRRYSVRNREGYVQENKWKKFDLYFSNERIEKVYPDLKLCNSNRQTANLKFDDFTINI